MEDQSLDQLRQELLDINYALLDLLNRRAEIVLRVKQIKDQGNIPPFSPEREHQMLQHLVENNVGPFSNETIGHLFKEIFRASLALMESQREKTLKVSRQTRAKDLTISLGKHVVGKNPIIMDEALAAGTYCVIVDGVYDATPDPDVAHNGTYDLFITWASAI